jgi:hypothetical protein
MKQISDAIESPRELLQVGHGNARSVVVVVIIIIIAIATADDTDRLPLFAIHSRCIRAAPAESSPERGDAIAS